MARALLGYVSSVGGVGNANQHALAHEVMRLRRRLAELESEVEQLRAQHTQSLETQNLDTQTLELELHLAGSPEPVLA